MNFSTIYKVFDTVVSVLDLRKDEAREQSSPGSSHTKPQNFAEQVETRLTNVVVAALKEAFDRDHARLELERAHLDEQRRRAEESMRLELSRQAVDREISRLRFLAAAGLLGWITSVVLLLARARDVSSSSRGVLIAGCILLLGSLGAALSAQASVGARAREGDGPLTAPAGAASLWLLLKRRKFGTGEKLGTI